MESQRRDGEHMCSSVFFSHTILTLKYLLLFCAVWISITPFKHSYSMDFALVSSWCPVSSCREMHPCLFFPTLYSLSSGRWSEVFTPTLQVFVYFHMLIFIAHLMPSAHFLGAFDHSNKLGFFHQARGFLMVESACQTGGFPRVYMMIS